MCRHEAKFIQKVVKVIEERLKRTILNVPPNLVGMESRVEHVNMWLQDSSTEVGIVALCGIGGIGKTTIAKYVFNLNSERFDASSFLANIREVSGLPNGLISLQMQLLSDISFGKEKKIWNVDEGIIRIRDVLSLKKVLLVLDDMDHIDQFEAILGMHDYIHPGSKIIITTRHKQLILHESYKIHEVEKLYFDDSIKLFSWYAFGQDYPFDAYEDYSKRMLMHCGGLPLALKVLGSSLYGKGVDVWKSALEKLEAITDQQIFKKLVISYDSLPDDHDKSLFLEIACFFVGERKDYTVTILDGCGLYTLVGIQNLVDRCLLTIDSGNKLTMHQMIRDMGREVIRQESPKEPGKRTRLWRCKDSFHVLRGNTGTETITGLYLDMKMVMSDNSVMSGFTNNSAKQWFRLGFLPWTSVDSSDICLTTDAFTRMRELSLLQINYTKLTGSYEKFPKNLKWLCWQGFPEKYVPFDFPLESLVAIDMHSSRLERVWKGHRFLGLLKILNLSHSHELISTPNFSSLPQLEHLILEDCISLIEVHESIGSLEMNLVQLNLKDCRNLRSLPRSICRLKVLESLVLMGCLNLEELPKEMTKMESLKVFCANEIEINPSAPTTSNDGLWYTLGSRWVSRPRKYPILSLNSLPKSLVHLFLSGCNLNTYSFPPELSNLPVLKVLDLSDNPICSLPDFIRGLNSLAMLQLYSCTMLQELIDLPETIQLLAVGCTSLKKIKFKSDVPTTPLPRLLRCERLVEWVGSFKFETIGNLDNEAMKNLGMYLYDLHALSSFEMNMLNVYTKTERKGPIQVLVDRCVINIFLPEGMVPGCFSNKSVGSSISMICPSSSSNTRFRGLNVCVVYTREEHWVPISIIYITISNETKDLMFMYCPTCYGLSKPNEDMTWLSHWMFPLIQLDVGDQLNISVVCSPGLKVKEIGVRVVSDDELTHSSENIVPMNVTRRQGTTRMIVNLGFFERGHDYIVELINYLIRAHEN